MGVDNCADGGTVWEWTNTTWCPDTRRAASRALNPNARRAVPPDCRGAARPKDPGEVDFVKRGGSFMCHKDSCYRYRSAARHKNTANSSASNLGFRCVWDARPWWVPPRAAAADGSAAA